MPLVPGTFQFKRFSADVFSSFSFLFTTHGDLCPVQMLLLILVCEYKTARLSLNNCGTREGRRTFVLTLHFRVNLSACETQGGKLQVFPFICLCVALPATTSSVKGFCLLLFCSTCLFVLFYFCCCYFLSEN